MKTINKEVVNSALKYWQKYTLTPILTFLSSKLAGVNTITYIHVGKKDDEKFLNEFLLENGNYYNPCTNKFPRNQLEYHKTIAQYRYKQEKSYSKAFEDGSYYGNYKFSNDYINATKNSIFKNRIKKLSLFNISVWLYRNHMFDYSDDTAVIKERFVKDFSITNEELSDLFDDDFYKNINIFKDENILKQDNVKSISQVRSYIKNTLIILNQKKILYALILAAFLYEVFYRNGLGGLLIDLPVWIIGIGYIFIPILHAIYNLFQPQNTFKIDIILRINLAIIIGIISDFFFGGLLNLGLIILGAK